MKMSAKKRQELYEAIANELMDYRIAVQKKAVNGAIVEEDLYYMTNRIWANVEKVLGL